MKPEKGKIDAQKFWKLKKGLFPKSMDPPTVMMDKEGNILTTDKAIEIVPWRFTQKGFNPIRLRNI